jgi:hypothetical protein
LVVATADESWAHLWGDVANGVPDVRRSIPLRGTARVRLPLLRL